MKAFLLSLVAGLQLFAAEVMWKPITPELLALKAPKIDPQADAEAIFWESWVEDYTQGGYAQHKSENYFRIKLFNARAVERWGDVKVAYPASTGSTISDFRGRVIKPNGTIIDVKGNQVKETTVAKTARISIRAKSFAFPSLEPGDIIEYKYVENVSGFYFRYVRLPMQMEIPAWEITHFVKPLSHPGFSEAMASYSFNVSIKQWEPVNGIAGRQGFLKAGVQNVPAFITEPLMPSEDDVKKWVLIYYTEDARRVPEKYWPSLGKKLNEDFRRSVKVNGDIKAAAADIAGKLSTPVEKANALAVFCQTKIRNVSYQAEGTTAQEREEFYKSKLKDEYDSGDTFKNKMGRPKDIRALFFALAQAAQLNPVYIAASSSENALFRNDFLDPFLLSDRSLIGIRDGAEWRVYNPGSPYLPAGMADEDTQGQPALVCDPKDAKLIPLPFSPPEKSARRRSADLKMDGDGAIKGLVRMVSTGHFGVDEKRYYDDMSPADRETSIRKQLESQYPAAQISDIKVEYANTVIGDFTVQFRIEMEGYGQRTGKRLFLQPGFFQFSKRPVFSSAKRVHPIQYDHPYLEVDSVTLELPDGFALDAADMPGAIKLGEIGDYNFGANYQKQTNKLIIKRELSWGKGGAAWFEAKSYPAIKQAWDRLHAADTHQLTLKEQAK